MLINMYAPIAQHVIRIIFFPKVPALFLTEINNISININTTSIASEIINLLPQD